MNIRIAGAQMDVEIGNVETNRNRIVKLINDAAESSAQLAIFPECALTGYCFDSLEEATPFAERLDGPSAEAIAAACRETGLYAIVGFIEKAPSGYFNAAMLVGPDGPLGTYRKVHLPFLGIDRFLTPGDRPFAAIDLPLGRIGINICYDLSFPEASRVLKLLGTQLIVLPTNWPPGAWRNPKFVINARAQENHVYIAAVNRVGVERGWQFIGRSKVVDCNGDTVAEAGSQDEELLVADLDLESANVNRIVNVPGSYEIDRLADRRPEFYAPVSASKAESKASETRKADSTAS
jgi:predicted amidohydrolase